MSEKIDFASVSYVLGILSIVFAFVSSWGIGGIVLGIIGLTLNKRVGSKSARKMSLIGLVLGIIIFLINVIATYYLVSTGAMSSLFPSV